MEATIRTMEIPEESLPVEPGQPGERSVFNSSGWLLLILGIALLLRCAFLSKESLWLDEVSSWWFASDLGRALTAERTNPPLYYTMLHFWVSCFGTSEAGLRSLSVVPGVLSVGLIYALTKKLFSRGIALGAALYQSISSFQIYYSQEARTFAWLEFFILAAGLALWNALEARTGKRRFLCFSGYALLSALSLYSHFITVFFLGGFGLFVLFQRRRQLIPFIASSAGAVLLFLPWLVTLFRATEGGGQQYRRYLLLKLPQAYFSFLFGDTLIPLDQEAVTHIRATMLHFGPLLLAAMFSVAVLLPFVWLAWKRWGDRLGYALMAATGSVLMAFLVSFKVMVFDERYLIAAAPFLYMVVAAAIAELLLWRRQGHVPLWQNWAALASVGLYSVLLLVSLYNYFFSPRFGREQWREAVAYVESQDSGKTFIVFDPKWLHSCYDYYQKRGLAYGSLKEISDRDKLAGYDSIWLVQSESDTTITRDIFGSQYKQDGYRLFPKGGGIEVSLFRPDHPVGTP
jgi:uncharacterized membrane protein